MSRLRPGPVALRVCVAVIGVLMIAPTIIIVVASFGSTRSLAFPPEGISTQWYENFFTDAWLPTAKSSLQIAVLTVLLATPLGTMAALGVARSRVPGIRVLQALFIAPMIIPTVILGIGLFQVFSTWRITGSMLGLVLAHTALALPFVFVTVGASLQTVDPALERAAANLGANPLRTFVQITLPLILPGVLSGALFAFVTSLDEVVVAIFLTSPQVTTLPVQIFATLQNYLDPTVAAISTLLLLVTLVVLLVTAVVDRARKTRGGDSPGALR
ncbi:MAG: putative spermidine/putrescine transport system permease protein [Solirubrobacteraceae bacterium]|jgi:putative spermidine/putrescine transport system permease protein|nr:putative spermidine/putrescine transport system permease protein [Solirubrobacteraceae bacterium]